MEPGGKINSGRRYGGGAGVFVFHSDLEPGFVVLLVPVQTLNGNVFLPLAVIAEDVFAVQMAAHFAAGFYLGYGKMG
jgi:hypothetical protein